MDVVIESTMVAFAPQQSGTASVKERPAYFSVAFMIQTQMESGQIALPQQFALVLPIDGLAESTPFDQVAAAGREALPKALRYLADAIEAGGKDKSD